MLLSGMCMCLGVYLPPSLAPGGESGSQSVLSDEMALSTVSAGLRKGKYSSRLRNGHPGLRTVCFWSFWQKRDELVGRRQKKLPRAQVLF